LVGMGVGFFGGGYDGNVSFFSTGGPTRLPPTPLCVSYYVLSSAYFVY
jgi:hypothetical protein